jgi:hypothetical protein
MAHDPVEAVTVTVTDQKENQPKADPMNIITEKENQSMREKAIIQVKFLTRVFTILTFILSLPVLGSVIWLLYMRGCDCEILLRLPKLQMGIGISLLFVFLVSNSVAFLASRFPMPGLVLVMAPLIVMLTMGLALTGAYKMESRTVPGSPMWLKLKVHNHNNWNNIRSCVYDSGACSDLVSRSFMLKSYDFSTKRLSHIEVIYIIIFCVLYPDSCTNFCAHRQICGKRQRKRKKVFKYLFYVSFLC